MTQIESIVHPQSIIHSLIQLCDGATLAHLGYPDMRVPIAYGLHYPERVERAGPPAGSVPSSARSRSSPSTTRRLPACGWPARPGSPGGTAPCTLNAANEIAVHAFLGGRLRFLQIAEVIEETLDRLPARRVHSFDSLADADAEARRVAGRAGEARSA